MEESKTSKDEVVHNWTGKINKIIRASIDIQRKVVALFLFLSKIIAILSAVVLLYNSIDGLLKQSFTIHPFDVPLAFSDNGFTGNFTSWQLSDEIAKIQKTGWSVSGFNVKRFQQDNIEADIVIFGISLNTVKSLSRSLLGIKDKAIKGSLLRKDNILYLKINLYNLKSIEITCDVNEFDNVYKAYDEIIRKASFEILHEVDPFVLASFYWANNNQKRSVDIIKEIIEGKMDGHDSAYLLWGEMLGNEEKYPQAIDKFKNSVEINPKNALAWSGWGWVLYEMGDRDDEAISKFQEVISQTDDVWHAWYYWGLILYRNNQNEEAIIKLKKAILTDKSRYEAYNEISYVFQTQGEVDTSIVYLVEGIKNSTNPGFLYATLAEMYWSQDKKEKAFTSLKKSLSQGVDIYQYIEVEPYKSFAICFPKKND